MEEEYVGYPPQQEEWKRTNYLQQINNNALDRIHPTPDPPRARGGELRLYAADSCPFRKGGGLYSTFGCLDMDETCQSEDRGRSSFMQQGLL
jgi:hypothetical protein